MKKFLLLVILPVLLSCILYSSPPIGESSFPLNKALTTAIETEIKEIAVGDTWIAVRTYNAIIALDIDTLKTIWTVNIQVSKFGEGFQIVNDVLYTASEEQIILIDRKGNQKEIALDADVKTITRILAANSDYLYVVGGPDWTIEAYDISQARILWKVRLGRNIGRVFYDPTKNVVHLTSNDFVRAYNNSSGELLWEMAEVHGRGTLYESGILYVPLPTSAENAFRLAAVNGENQRILWERDVPHPPEIEASSSTIIHDLLIYRGYGMIAVDKSNGDLVWTTPSMGEEFYDTPVELDGVIYVKGNATGTVYAISLEDGTLIGQARLEDIGFGGVSGHIFTLEDGIVFNTKHEVVFYSLK